MPETWTLLVHAVGPERLGVHPAGAWLIMALLLALATPALAATTRCTTYEEKTMQRLQTLCDDGTRAVSTYNKTLGRVGHDHYQKHAISFIPLGVKVYGLQWSIRQISAISWNR
jgi:hypothetical protein